MSGKSQIKIPQAQVNFKDNIFVLIIVCLGSHTARVIPREYINKPNIFNIIVKIFPLKKFVKMLTILAVPALPKLPAKLNTVYVPIKPPIYVIQ